MKLHQQQVPTVMELVCRDSSKLVIQIQHSREMVQSLIKTLEKNETKSLLPSNNTNQEKAAKKAQMSYDNQPYFMYLVKVQESANPFGERIIFLVITLECN